MTHSSFFIYLLVIEKNLHYYKTEYNIKITGVVKLGFFEDSKSD